MGWEKEKDRSPGKSAEKENPLLSHPTQIKAKIFPVFKLELSEVSHQNAPHSDLKRIFCLSSTHVGDSKFSIEASTPKLPTEKKFFHRSERRSHASACRNLA